MITRSAELLTWSLPTKNLTMEQAQDLSKHFIFREIANIVSQARGKYAGSYNVKIDYDDYARSLSALAEWRHLREQKTGQLV